MAGNRTSLCIDFSRIISTEEDNIDLWLTLSNIHKLKDRGWVNIFLGNNVKEDWKRVGIYKIGEKISNEEKSYKGITYHRYRLDKINI